MLLLMSYIYLYMFIPTSINYVTLKSRSDNLQFDPNLSWQGLDRFPHIQPWRTALSAALSSFTEATWMGTTAERHMLNTHQPIINPSKKVKTSTGSTGSSRSNSWIHCYQNATGRAQMIGCRKQSKQLDRGSGMLWWILEKKYTTCKIDLNRRSPSNGCNIWIPNLACREPKLFKQHDSTWLSSKEVSAIAVPLRQSHFKSLWTSQNDKTIGSLTAQNISKWPIALYPNILTSWHPTHHCSRSAGW